MGRKTRRGSKSNKQEITTRSLFEGKYNRQNTTQKPLHNKQVERHWRLRWDAQHKRKSWVRKQSTHRHRRRRRKYRNDKWCRFQQRHERALTAGGMQHAIICISPTSHHTLLKELRIARVDESNPAYFSSSCVGFRNVRTNQNFPPNLPCQTISHAEGNLPFKWGSIRNIIQEKKKKWSSPLKYPPRFGTGWRQIILPPLEWLTKLPIRLWAIRFGHYVVICLTSSNFGVIP